MHLQFVVALPVPGALIAGSQSFDCKTVMAGFATLLSGPTRLHTQVLPSTVFLRPHSYRSEYLSDPKFEPDAIASKPPLPWPKERTHPVRTGSIHG
jgi:hypothetical protein